MTDIREKAKHASKQLATGEAHSNYGMKFLISQAKTMGMKREFMEEVFAAIAHIHYQEPQELVKEPEEDDPNFDEAKEAAQAANEETERKNEELNKLKSFVKLVTPLEDEPATPEYKDFDEKCFIRVKNYRDPLTAGAEASIETTGQ